MEPREQNVSGASAEDITSKQPAQMIDLRHVAAATTQVANGPQLADDADMIEDEWIAIVKRAIDQYRDEPYALARAIAMLRADYLKKRYDKEIKVAN